MRFTSLASIPLLATAMAPRLMAQRVEVAARAGYLVPAGTQFQMASTNGGSSWSVRSWNGGGLSVGAAASYWLNAHFGVQGTADLRFVRHRAAYAYSCTTLCFPVALPPGPRDASTTHLVASLRFAARQRLGDRLRLGAGVGPAMIRFGDPEYRPSASPDFGFSGAYRLAHRLTYGVGVGVCAAYLMSSRVRLSVSTDDVLYRAWPADASSWSTVAAPMQHELTFSAAAAVAVP
jgi:hypothetical protein